jgi:hypothetical protein
VRRELGEGSRAIRGSALGGEVVIRRLVVLALIALGAGGCAYMRMQRPPSPELVRCGTVPVPFWYPLEGAQNYVYREEDCIETREAEGYVAALPEPYFFFFSSGSLYTGQPTYTKMP